MRLKRQKTYKRYMSVYQHSFGFREPYQIIVDGNFIKVAQNARLDYKSMLQETVVGKTRIMTTNCVLNELRTLGEDFMGAALAAKRLEKRRCTHGGNPVNAADCIKEIIGDSNQFNYCVATQDLQFKRLFKTNSRSVMILEPPSPATENKVKEIEYNKTIPTNYESTIIKNNTKQPEEAPKSKKRKGPKQPNPLSCKRKRLILNNNNNNKEESENNEDAEVEKPKKRRRRRTKKKNYDTKNNEDNKEDFNNKTNEE
ncbi:Fcf1-domain-containing protein [Neocallimastix lanati (nom. inval.)]|nr:Fcf1-domain-containing protein [Neocallimastix sp. JGI-2020a]